MSPFVIVALDAIASLIKLKADGQFSALKGDVDRLIDQLKATLPAKPDGSAYTDLDIVEAAAAARVGFLSVLARG